MRVLLSAYACGPGIGSEPGVGWNWSTELARLGHEVVVITRSVNRKGIEKALAKDPIAGLSFYHYDLPSWAEWGRRKNRGIYLHYWLWQHGAYRMAKRLTSEIQFDLVHHVTFGVFRQPSYMGRLGLPFVVGPLGGAESTPALLRGSFPPKAAFLEMLREVSNKVTSWNPSVPAMFRQATVIFCRTRETLAILPAVSQEKARLHRDIGVEPHRIRQETVAPEASADFLYAGRLIYWKGLHLALKAFSQLRTKLPNATLTVIGGGKDEAQLKKLSVALRLQDSVRWLGRIPQEEIWACYCRYTAFVFPSMHDSGGTVVLEALSQGLPVICLDTGGPGAIVSPTCGIKVAVENRNEAEVVSDLAAAMQKLAEHPELRAQMANRALDFAKVSTWRDVVYSAYAHIGNTLNASGNAGIDRTD